MIDKSSHDGNYFVTQMHAFLYQENVDEVDVEYRCHFFGN